MEFRTDNVERKPYIAMVHRGAYDKMGSTWESVFQVAGPNGWAGPNIEMVGVYNDDPSEVPEDQLTSYACITEPAGFGGHEGFEKKDVGGGKYLIGTYTGSYSGLGEAWQTMMAKVGEHDTGRATTSRSI